MRGEEVLIVTRRVTGGGGGGGIVVTRSGAIDFLFKTDGYLIHAVRPDKQGVKILRF